MRNRLKIRRFFYVKKFSYHPDNHVFNSESVRELANKRILKF